VRFLSSSECHSLLNSHSYSTREYLLQWKKLVDIKKKNYVNQSVVYLQPDKKLKTITQTFCIVLLHFRIEGLCLICHSRKTSVRNCTEQNSGKELCPRYGILALWLRHCVWFYGIFIIVRGLCMIIWNGFISGKIKKNLLLTFC
jgi:hypothetical protein